MFLTGIKIGSVTERELFYIQYAVFIHSLTIIEAIRKICFRSPITPDANAMHTIAAYLPVLKVPLPKTIDPPAFLMSSSLPSP